MAESQHEYNSQKFHFLGLQKKERGLQTKSARIIWLGLAGPSTRLFIQGKKKAIAKTEK